MVDELPNRTNMILNLLRERQRLAYQSSNPLPQCVVEPLTVVCLPAILAHRPVSLRWQHTRIRLPEIAVADRTLAVDRWQRPPQLPSRCLVPRPNGTPNTFTGVTVQGQPDPLLGALLAHK